MKKKYVSKWLHRLPVLFLALILVVMPLTMAAPAHADVLTSQPTAVISAMGFNVTFPLMTPNFFVSYALYSGGAVATFYFVDGVYTLIDNGDLISVLGDIVLMASVFLTSDVPYYILEPDDFRPYPTALPQNYNPELFAPYGDYINETGFRFEYPLPRIIGGPGVLDTFFGVGTWLSGAVQNISTMFWTAESGMTVLGYLAVASLALAVILLIFYLIAGWLKFH